MSYVMLAAGLALLLLGGELLVQGAVALSNRIGVSPLLVGLTVVGFGTSTPELAASLGAAFAGSPGIALGNVVGSNTANILLIVGVAALIHPLAIRPTAVWRDGGLMLLVALACVAVALVGVAGRMVGLLFILMLLAYLVVAYFSERGASQEMAKPRGSGSLTRALGCLVLGLVFVVLGADLLVDASIVLARGIGVSEAVIGLTVVAIGTSLPELVTSVMAAIRRQGDVALGNVLGSNIYNVLGILGITALVHPVAVPSRIVGIDVWVMLAATVALLAALLLAKRVRRGVGIVFVAVYAAYTASMAWS